MKKILYISYDGMTDPLGQSQVLPYMAGLAGEGYEFTLLSFEKKKRYEVSGQKIQSLCEKHAIKWVPLFFSRRPPFLSKLYDQWRMKRMVVKLHQKQQFDFTHCRSYVAAAAGLKLFKKYQVPFLFDMRGFWVDERVDNGQWDLKKPLYRFFYKLYKQKEKNYFKEAKHIISLTEKGKDELISAYAVPPVKISVIPCCADLSHFDYNRITEDERRVQKSKIVIAPDVRLLSYLGSLGGWYLTNEMLDFYAVLREVIPSTKFLFITQDNREEVIKIASAKGISPDDILVHPATREEVPSMLSICDWSVFFIKDAYSKKASSPTKQGEIMAMGIPLVCNDIGDTGKIIADSETGFLITSFKRDEYLRLANQLKTGNVPDKNKIRQEAIDKFSLNNGVLKYKLIYENYFK